MTRWYQNQYWWLILVVMPWLEAMVAGDGRLKKELQRLNWLVVMEMYAGGSMGLIPGGAEMFMIIQMKLLLLVSLSSMELMGNGVVGVVSLNGVALVRTELEMNLREVDHAVVDVTGVQWNQVEEKRTDDVECSCMNFVQETDLAPPIEYLTNMAYVTARGCIAKYDGRTHDLTR
ncbi:hypothetical protein C5167_008062 [Papaver somniferum]|uniref:Uncharacterized protein n=1 Tax=Papaver somniferum TaxID=3469 RepID=A0A4Y7JWL8_PAPSO|nr:hypothetical protein C5167_008062 [Papaver somniferum]